MIEFRSKLKKWGRSFGVVVPMDELRKFNIDENTTVEIMITKQESPLRKHFGKAKFKRPIKEILDEGDRESWDE